MSTNINIWSILYEHTFIFSPTHMPVCWWYIVFVSRWMTSWWMLLFQDVTVFVSRCHPSRWPTHVLDVYVFSRSPFKKKALSQSTTHKWHKTQDERKRKRKKRKCVLGALWTNPCSRTGVADRRHTTCLKHRPKCCHLLLAKGKVEHDQYPESK